VEGPRENIKFVAAKVRDRKRTLYPALSKLSSKNVQAPTQGRLEFTIAELRGWRQTLLCFDQAFFVELQALPLYIPWGVEKLWTALQEILNSSSV